MSVAQLPPAVDKLPLVKQRLNLCGGDLSCTQVSHLMPTCIYNWLQKDRKG